MKTFKLLILIAGMLLLSNNSFSQQAVLYDGELTFLKEQTELNVEFVYTGMKVGEFNEEIYLQQKRKELKKPADGDKFVKKWYSDRTEVYETKFVDQFNKDMKRLNIISAKNTQTAKYTMLVQTVRLEPGYFDGANSSKRNTFIDLRIKFVETQNHDNVLATIKADFIVGITDDQYQMKETTLRIENAYKTAAGKTADLIVKISTQKTKAKPTEEENLKHDDKDKPDDNAKDDVEDEDVKKDDKVKKEKVEKEKKEKEKEKEKEKKEKNKKEEKEY